MPVLSPLPGPNQSGTVHGLVTRFTQEWYAWLNQVFRITFSQQQSGTTAQRPTSGLWIGRRYFDTTLGYPIWVQAVTPAVIWVDATGAAV